jgi:hypothetical protein
MGEKMIKKEINYKISHPIAILKYKLGFKPIWTHNIADELNCGYGEMDWNGFWQYPLYFKGEK